VQITLIGHNTLLIECDGQRILTDPYFELGGNPFYVRVAPPALPREALCDVSLVLVSHTHWDHIDAPYLRMLSAKVAVLAPWQSTWEACLRSTRAVQGLRAWQSRQVGQVTITAVPALHLTFALGFVIEGEGRRVYFAGDTFYMPAMRAIGRRFALDVALIPVTTFRPPMTMGEAGAVRAARDLNPALIIPIHLGVQPRMRFLRTGHSVAGFERRLRAAGLQMPVVRLKEGQTWSAPPASKG
jgi:L-ascorbate metabolism protein UlaG (beta-lactamase superfamily)